MKSPRMARLGSGATEGAAGRTKERARLVVGAMTCSLLLALLPDSPAAGAAAATATPPAAGPVDGPVAGPVAPTPWVRRGEPLAAAAPDRYARFRLPAAAQRGRAAPRLWYQQPNGAPAWADRWLYPDLPVACYQPDAAGGATASAWQVLWVRPAGEPSTLASKLANARTALAAAGSVFPASAGRFFGSDADLYRDSLTPRWVTTADCRIDVREVAAPVDVYDRGPWATSEDGLRDWLVAQGFSEPNRKYVVLLQRTPRYATGGNPEGGWQPHAENYALSFRDGDPGPGNAANFSSFLFVAVSGLPKRPDVGMALWYAPDIAHEMVHALGAMAPGAPHANRSNPGHPSDCNDVLCYGDGYPGEQYDVGCGGVQDGGGVIAARLDCNQDDYFSAAGGPPWAPVAEGAWTAQRWSISHSSFLYGNPQPTAAQLAAHPTPVHTP